MEPDKVGAGVDNVGSTRPGLGRTAAYGLVALLSVMIGQTCRAQSFSSLNGPNPTGLITLPGLNQAQRTMARAIDNVCPTINNIAATSDQRDLATICVVMTGTALAAQGQSLSPALQRALGVPAFPSLGLGVGGVKNALQDINGGAEILVPTTQTSQLRNLQVGAIGARLSILRNRMAGQMASADPMQPYRVALNFSDAEASDAGHALISAASPTDIEVSSGGFGIYVNLLGQFGDGDQTDSVSGYSFHNLGFLVGADYQFSPKFVAGAAFGYTHSSTDFDVTPASPPGQSLHGDLYQGNLYATYYATDALYIEGMATIAGGRNHSVRHLIIPGLAAPDRLSAGSFGTDSYGVSIGGGYNLPFGAWTLTPTVRLEYHRVTADAFAENGAAGLDLTYGNTGENAVLSVLGAQAQYAISTDFGVLSPTARFTWSHQYNRGNTAITVGYKNDPSLLSTFLLTGDSASRNYYDLGIGLATQFAGNIAAFINYDAILGLSHTSYNSFTGGVRFSF
jgi:outer membrane lipase/esterase